MKFLVAERNLESFCISPSLDRAAHSMLTYLAELDAVLKALQGLGCYAKLHDMAVKTIDYQCNRL
jgi:hypothetical protein